MTSKQKGLHVFFCKRWEPCLPGFSGFYPDIQVFCPDLRQIKTFGTAIAPSEPSPPTSLPQGKSLGRVMGEQL